VIGFALAVAAATLVVGLLATLAVRLLPTVRLQLAALGLLAVVLPLAAVLLSGWVMFHMGDDVKILAVAAASAAAAVAAALGVGTTITRRLDRLRSASGALAAGDLSARAPDTGPRELAELGRSFNDMGASLERLFDARRDLVAAAGHDLQTPIASIVAMLEAIEDGLARPDEYLEPLREQARRLQVLVADLFELARIDAGVLQRELEEIRLAPLVETCLRGIDAEARARSIRLERHVEDDASVRCIPEQVERVLLNLLTNALRHTPPDGTIAVRLTRRDADVRVTVEDDGEGLTPEAERRMFDRFWRADTSRTPGEGAGLGLAIARGLVEAHGGHIWGEPRTGGGARVSFTLPAAGSSGHVRGSTLLRTGG
jgi:signal transduction histidine kinase